MTPRDRTESRHGELVRSLGFLVVEDHEFQRNMLVRMLRGLHARSVHGAVDGRAGLDLLQRHPADIDVIISDLDMPGMDGMEFIRHVGAAGRGVSLIVASALERELLASVETMATAHGIHFLGSIEKPVTPGKLEQLIRLHGEAPQRHRVEQPAKVAFTADEIAEGIENDEFEPYFQPKVEIENGRVIGAEALARWRHPRLGLLSPAVFVGALETSGRIDMLMRCMLRKAARTWAELRRRGHNGSVCVNVSLKSLHDVTLADQILEIVRSHGLEPQRVVLEITESAATDDIAATLENLTRLRMKGFGLSIDDYGTGYSSLEQLTRIPFTELKIDQAFVTHAGRRESAKVILASSLDMARKLRICAVAEGVETRENWDMLLELKCQVAQGYYIARPMAAAAYLEWVDDWAKMRGS
jgi:EAL domain-containing protein (putative c-di-GMP-specific phosphodiesterase class I)/FixJ family two-component response regulator